MLRSLMLLICFTVSVFCTAQSKSKPVPNYNTSELKRLLTTTGLPYRLVSDSLAVIPYEGANIKSYSVVVQRISDLYIIYCSLTEALPGKIDQTKYKYLMQLNDHYDIVKTGLSADGETVYLRADLYKSVITPALFKRIISQVANVTNIIGGELK